MIYMGLTRLVVRPLGLISRNDITVTLRVLSRNDSESSKCNTQPLRGQTLQLLRSEIKDALTPSGEGHYSTPLE